MSLKDDIERVPSWIWLGGAAAAGILLFLHGRSTASSASGPASAPLTSGNGQISGVQTGLTSAGTLPSQNPPPPLSPTVTGYSFSQYLSGLGQGIPGLDAAQQQQAYADYRNVGAQFSGFLPTDQQAAFNAWWAQGQAFGPAAATAGKDPAASQFSQWVAAGEQFVPALMQVGNPVVPGIGYATGTSQPAISPLAGVYGLPSAASGGGGGYSYHPAAQPAGNMKDALGLTGPANPSIYG